MNDICNQISVTPIRVSRRIAELLGPPPTNPIDWDSFASKQPRIISSAYGKQNLPTSIPNIDLPLSQQSDKSVDSSPAKVKRRTSKKLRRRPHFNMGDSPIPNEDLIISKHNKQRRLKKRQRRKRLTQTSMRDSFLNTKA